MQILLNVYFFCTFKKIEKDDQQVAFWYIL